MLNIIEKQTQESILQGLLFGVFAVIANLFLSIPIYGALSLTWGMGLCIYVLISFGIRASIITLAFSLFSMYILDQPLTDIVISLAEFITIAYLTHKRFFVVMASSVISTW